MGPLPYAVLSKTVMLLSLALPLQADLLSELRGRLSSLQGISPLSGSADYQLYTRTKDGGDIHTEEGRIRIHWAWSNPGLQLQFSESTLDEAEREQRARRSDPEKPAPTRSALFSFTALQIAEAIDFATILLRELEGAQILDARRTGDDTALTLKLTPRLGRTEKKHVRNEEIRMVLRLGPDGVPVSAERTIRIRASFFFIRIDNNRTDRWTLVQRGDRLIAVRHEEEEIATGMTRAVTTRSLTVLSFDQAARSNSRTAVSSISCTRSRRGDSA